MGYLLYYLLLINAIAFFVCAFDKRAARKHRWRIPEKTLFLLAILGGSVGLYLSMLLFHHKTKHKKFTVGLPVILFLQLIIICFIINLKYHVW